MNRFAARNFILLPALGAASLLWLGRTCAAEAPPPVAPVYALDQKLLATDFERLDWNDASRNRAIPVKIYFPTDGGGPFPVIIFSHGLGGSRETYEYLGRQWAASGYVVIHPQHVGSDTAAIMTGIARAANFQNAIDRDRDIHFVIDQLDALNANDAKLKGKLDAKKIGMAGHSFGAQTTMLIAGQSIGGPIVQQRIDVPLIDARVTSAIAMSEPIPMMKAKLSELYGGVKIPVFFMTGTNDDSPIGDTKAADRRLAFDAVQSNALLLTLSGGDHMVFSGRLLSRPTDPPMQRWIRLASTAFWNETLRNDDAAKKWLVEGGFKTSLGDAGVFEQK